MVLAVIAEEQTNRKTDEKQEVKLEKLFTGLYSRLDTIIEVLGHMAGQQKEAEHIKPSNLLIPHTPPQPRPVRKAINLTPSPPQPSPEASPADDVDEDPEFARSSLYFTFHYHCDCWRCQLDLRCVSQGKEANSVCHIFNEASFH